MQCSKSHSSLHHHHHHQHGHHEKYSIPQSASLKERLHHFTWAWFACTLSTGGTALLLAAAPYRFPGLTGIGAAIFVLNLGLFLVLTVAILARFVLFAGSFMSSIDNPTESLFIPTFWMSLATVSNEIIVQLRIFFFLKKKKGGGGGGGWRS